jgi:DNA transformation protein
MARGSEFVRHVIELMAPIGEVRARGMFGGYSICLREAAFAIVADGRLYFKTDSVTRPGYEKLGMDPFTYVARGKRVALQYHEAPPDALESPHIMRSLALEAVAASLRSRGRRKKRPRMLVGRRTR